MLVQVDDNHFKGLFDPLVSQSSISSRVAYFSRESLLLVWTRRDHYLAKWLWWSLGINTPTLFLETIGWLTTGHFSHLQLSHHASPCVGTSNFAVPSTSAAAVGHISYIRKLVTGLNA
ncbi:hypothetical protein BDN72DRAFT_844303 [Pluteus cervinus]|uniref:Uncharacterized protein n=1 Tax=Pluteus cervinus TaxID=181527 RepID=A0ACD3AL75_9AGAR|nr:hypothetical protein BDN72DRAFT_844303 [Pluteus cervinus]